MSVDRLGKATKDGGTYCLLLDRACQASLVHMGTLGIKNKQKIKKHSCILKNHFLGGRADKGVYTCSPTSFHRDSRLDSISNSSPWDLPDEIHVLIFWWSHDAVWVSERLRGRVGSALHKTIKSPDLTKANASCVCVCVYKNIRDGDQTALGAVWVRSEAWAALDMLVNEQIRQPPPQPPTALLHPALHPSPSAVTLTDCTPDPLALSWLKFYNNHRAPVATSLVFEHRDGQIDTVHIQTFSATAAHAVLWPPHLRDRATELFFNTLTHTEEYMTHRN